MVNTARNFLIMLKKSAADALKTATKRVIQETAEATGDLIDNKIANLVAKSYDGRTTKASKNSLQNNSVANEHDKEIPKKRYVSPEERQEIIDELRLN